MEDAVDDVSKEPKPVESMPSITVEKDDARTGEVLAGKPAACDRGLEDGSGYCCSLRSGPASSRLQTRCAAVAACCTSDRQITLANGCVP